MADGAYVYEFADGIYVKPQATEEMAVSPEFTDSTHVKLANLDKYKKSEGICFSIQQVSDMLQRQHILYRMQ